MEYCVPELGEGVYQAEFVEWLVRPGDMVRQGHNLAEVMTDKATMELPAPFAGTIDALAAEPGETIEVGQKILTYTPAQDGSQIPAAVLAQTTTQSNNPSAAPASVAPMDEGSSSQGSTSKLPASAVVAAPAVRQLARSLRIDLSQVRGSGPGGRVLIDDLAALLQLREPSVSRPSRSATAHDLGTAGERARVQGLRRTIAENMVASKTTIPHFSYIDECDVSAMVALRSKLKRDLYKQNVKLTYLPFYIKAVAAALREVPVINASYDEEAGEITYHDHYHIGFATATPKGLIVPVIRHADRCSLADVARDIERLGRAAQAGEISRDDIRGGTFTVSSVGNFGGLVSTPIINHPEVAILAIGKVFKRPVFDDDEQIVPARIVYLSFSFDHRVIDGSVGAIFSNAIIRHLKDPESLIDPQS